MTVAAPADSASTAFREYLSNQVVQSRCIKCQVRGGLSEYTRLVFEPGSVADHQSRNQAVFEGFVSTVPGGADIVLDKIRGVAHGGEAQVPSGTAEFANMERFLRLLESRTAGTALSPETLFEGVTIESPARTLRRAALVFAGRIPTPQEFDSVRDGGATILRRAIKGLMRGRRSHEFLIRASNDRLLTDRHLFSVFNLRMETDLANLQWRAAKQALDRGYERAMEDPSYATWEAQTQFGISRAPLELIAHVDENDQPYTEILTADYIMANPLASKGYGSSTEFDIPVSEGQFRPSKIVNHFRNDYSKISEFDVRYGTRIISAGSLETTYPHAGILNTRVFLRRYPTTATNRNRARPLAPPALPRRGRREACVPADRSRGPYRHRQPHEEKSVLHGLTLRSGPGRRRVPELRRGRVLQEWLRRHGLSAAQLQGFPRRVSDPVSPGRHVVPGHGGSRLRGRGGSGLR